MIAQSVIDEIQSLLAEGRLSQRKIAQLLGVGRMTVSAVAAGRRRDWPQPPRDDTFSVPSGPRARCSLCGGMVYLPCRLCHVRQQIAQQHRQQRPYRDPRPEPPLALHLRDEHRRRYEAIRARRRHHE